MKSADVDNCAHVSNMNQDTGNDLAHEEHHPSASSLSGEDASEAAYRTQQTHTDSAIDTHDRMILANKHHLLA
jgi:hypothetical protein